jgi:glycerophosphoryl diester phosphodiesterase
MNLRDELIGEGKDQEKALRFRNRPSIRLGIRKRTVFYSLLALLALYFVLPMYLNQPLGEIQSIAHRGGPAYRPENTMAAFRQAIADGVDWLEFDVQMTSDGVLVVFHDETLERTTNGEGPLAQISLADLQALDAGNGERVPAFREVIQLAKSVGIGILPEAKSPHLYEGIEAAMVAEIERARYESKTIVQSFDAETLEAIHALNPAIRTCKLYGLWEFSVSGPQPGEGPAICPMAEMVALYPWMLRDAHQNGLTAFVWFGVIEHPITMRLMLLYGADGLMADDQLALTATIAEGNFDMPGEARLNN